MKNTIKKINSINTFTIPTKIFERAYNFYNIMYDTHLDIQTDFLGDEVAILGNSKKENAVQGCITSNKSYKVSDGGICVFLNAEGKIDEMLNRVIPAGGRIRKPKTRYGENQYIAQIQDSEGNIIGLHDYES